MFKRLKNFFIPKNCLRYVLPCSLVLALFTAYSIASQSFVSGTTGTVVSKIDDNGGYTVSGTGAFNFSPAALSVIGTGGQVAAGKFNGATLSGGTLNGGTLSVSEPFQGAGFKEVIITATSAYAVGGGTLVFQWPAPFTTGGTNAYVSGGNNLAGSAASTFTGAVGGTGGTLQLSGTASGTMVLVGN